MKSPFVPLVSGHNSLKTINYPNEIKNMNSVKLISKVMISQMLSQTLKYSITLLQLEVKHVQHLTNGSDVRNCRYVTNFKSLFIPPTSFSFQVSWKSGFQLILQCTSIPFARGFTSELWSSKGITARHYLKVKS